MVTFYRNFVEKLKIGWNPKILTNNEPGSGSKNFRIFGFQPIFNFSDFVSMNS